MKLILTLSELGPETQRESEEPDVDIELEPSESEKEPHQIIEPPLQSEGSMSVRKKERTTMQIWIR